MAHVFRNGPTLTGDSGEQRIKRYVHSKLSVDHNGIQATINENGKVTLAKAAGKDEKTGDILIDEIEIPASLVFKLASLLKATRKVVFVPVSDITLQHSTASAEESE